MTSGARLPRQGAGRRDGGWAALVATAACLVAFFWMGLGWHTLTLRSTYIGKRGDHYSSLVHGFLSGHTYLDKAPDPRLESMDPAVRATAETLLDASYFNRHFYLYFGAAPAVLLLLPYAWVSGNDLDPRVVSVLCVGIGFLFSAATWRMFVRDHAPRLGAALQLFGVATLGFAPATTLLLTRSLFYEVVIAGGYACVMAGAFWIYRSLSGRGRPERQLAAASLCLGIATACRPDLVLTVPALAACAFVLARRGRQREPLARGLERYGLAAVVPAALIGACIGAYNFERFGSPFDFGFRYSQNAFFAGRHSMAGAGFFWTNLRWDYLTLPALSPYFPYVFPEKASFRPPGYFGGEAIHGQLPVLLLVVFVAASGLAFRRRVAWRRAGAFLAILGGMFAAPFIGLSFLDLRADRYMVDFQQSLVLATVLLAALVAASLARGAGRALWILGFSALAMEVTAFNGFAGLQEFDAFRDLRFPAYNALETIGNAPSQWLWRRGVLPWGPVEMKVVFPRNVPVSRIEPLLALGTTGLSDGLYVLMHEGGQEIELLDDHQNYGGHRSPVLTIVPGKTYTLRVDMGSFYPPLNHPFFRDYSVLQKHIAKTRLSVEMDGKVVFRDMMNAYDAPPWSLEPGGNDITLTAYDTAFTGQILDVRRLPPPPPEVTVQDRGLWRIRCVLPLQYPHRQFPLLSMGLTGKGTLLFATTLPNNTVSFGIDEWGTHGANSPELHVDPGAEHVVEIFVGSLAQNAVWPREWSVDPAKLTRAGRTLRLWLDGRLVWETNLVRDPDPVDSFIDVGTNLEDFSSAEPYFYGPIRSDPYLEAESREFLNQNLPDRP